MCFLVEKINLGELSMRLNFRILFEFFIDFFFDYLKLLKFSNYYSYYYF